MSEDPGTQLMAEMGRASQEDSLLGPLMVTLRGLFFQALRRRPLTKRAPCSSPLESPRGPALGTALALRCREGARTEEVRPIR